MKGIVWHAWCDMQDANEAECRRFAEAVGFREWRHALRLWEQDYDRFMRWLTELGG